VDRGRLVALRVVHGEGVQADRGERVDVEAAAGPLAGRSLERLRAAAALTANCAVLGDLGVEQGDGPAGRIKPGPERIAAIASRPAQGHATHVDVHPRATVTALDEIVPERGVADRGGAAADVHAAAVGGGAQTTWFRKPPAAEEEIGSVV